MFQWIHRFSILPNFKMKFYQTRVSISHLGDFLPFCYCLSFLYQEFTVVGVGTKVSVVMFDNDELTVTAQSCAAINHFPRSRRGYRLPGLARNIDALGAFGKSFQDFTFSRP